MGVCDGFEGDEFDDLLGAVVHSGAAFLDLRSNVPPVILEVELERRFFDTERAQCRSLQRGTE